MTIQTYLSAEDKKTDEPPKAKDTAEEIPKDFKLPITKEGQSEIITTLKVSEIHPFEGHPFNVKDDKDMMDLVDSVKKFGVLEPVVVIPRKGRLRDGVRSSPPSGLRAGRNHHHAGHCPSA